jgi:hypothetical protein
MAGRERQPGTDGSRKQSAAAVCARTFSTGGGIVAGGAQRCSLRTTGPVARERLGRAQLCAQSRGDGLDRFDRRWSRAHDVGSGIAFDEIGSGLRRLVCAEIARADSRRAARTVAVVRAPMAREHRRL